jgi:hypothetical protein
MLLPVQTTSSSAAPTIAPKIATPDSAVDQVRGRGGRGGYRGGGYRGRSAGRSYRGRSFGRSYRGGRHSYRGRRYGGRHYGHRHGRYYRRGYVYGAGIPLLYGGLSYYGGCSYYYRKWQRTGSRYWHNMYRRCGW